MIAEGVAVTTPVAVEADVPHAARRKRQAITGKRAGGKVCHDHDVVARTMVLPPLVSDHLRIVVDVKDGDAAAAEAAGVGEPVAAEVREVAVEKLDAVMRG